MNNRVAIIIISVILVLATIGGVVVMLIPRKSDNPVGTEPSKNQETTPSEDSTTEPTEEIKKTELTSPPEGHTPIPDLDEGNEIFLDMDVVSKLQQMEDNGDEDEVNLILDTMLLLINEFVDRGYSKLAVGQVQRFYFTFRTEIGGMDFNTLCDKIGRCIGESGATEENFINTVQEQFGAVKDFDYVFDAEVNA